MKSPVIQRFDHLLHAKVQKGVRVGDRVMVYRKELGIYAECEIRFIDDGEWLTLRSCGDNPIRWIAHIDDIKREPEDG